MERQQITITLPDVHTHKYKTTAKQIEELVKGLNAFTNSLEDKVNTMLKGQETEFVNSYKDHMHKVEQCLKSYQNKIDDNQKIIEHYENEGMLANLLKKINFLENNQKKLLTTVEKKDKAINVLKGEISTQSREILSLQDKIKKLLLSQQNTKTTLNGVSKQSQPTFATEVHTHSKQTLLTNRSIEYLKKENPQFMTITPIQDNPQKLSAETQNQELGRFKRQLVSLKKKNRELSSFNSKILDKASSIEEFFLKTVNDLKKKIASRKKFTACSFEDFKQEDKLELLIKVLSNEEILQHLYNKIFKKEPVYEAKSKEQKLQNLSMTERVIGRLPAITSLRR